MWGPDEWDEYFQAIQGWGTQELLETLVAQFFPEGDVSDAEAMQTLSWMRTAVSPAGALALSRIYMETDVRGILGSVQASTLVLHRTGDLIESVAGSRYVASMIPRARFVELPGANHLWYAGDRDSVIDEIQTFLTGSRPPPPALERVLVTVLFTDIVRSTELAVRLGDRRWTEVLAEHDRRARAEIERFRGRYIGSAGDGMLSTFDGPARAVRCAQAIQAATVDLGLRIRTGAHTGEVELDGQDVRGVSVHACARVAASAEADEVLVTKTVKDLVAGSGLRFEDRGIHKLRGVPDEWQLYAALPG